MHHHEHLFGRFVAWLCQACNKAEAPHYVTVVTSNLKVVAKLTRARDDGLGRTRISTLGDWKDPYAMQMSWQCGEKRRMAMRLLCVERLLDVEGYLPLPLPAVVATLDETVPAAIGIHSFRCTTLAPRRHFCQTKPRLRSLSRPTWTPLPC